MGIFDISFYVCALLLCSFSFPCNVVEASHGVFSHLQSVEPPTVGQKYRTAYHFQPLKNWINDPNGPMYYKGLYHFFYQYNTHGAVWGNIVWAHSISKDLINWTPLENAIYPSKPFDINGCWSGSATILPSSNKPVILYTGIDPMNRQVQNIAFPKNLSDPYLREWTKPDYNPVMAPINNGINASSFRDPTTAWMGPDGAWRVLIGSKRDTRGIAILYKSKDFVKWIKAKHPLHSSEGTGMWECPDFFPVAEGGKLNGLDTSITGKGVKHVLKVSLDDTKFEYYTVGRYLEDKDRYIPDEDSVDNKTGLRYDYGKFYASKTFYDSAKKRRILWGWMNESDSVMDDVVKGWAGVQGIPRTIWLDSNGKQLVQWPVKEVESLREKEVQLNDKILEKSDLVEIKGISSAQADVMVDFELKSLKSAEAFNPSWTDPQVLCSQKGSDTVGGVGPFGLLVLASQGMDEYTAVFFRVFKDENKYKVLMCSDQSRSTLQTDVDKTTYGGFVDVDIEKSGKISLRTLIDHSIVESFGGEGRTCITSRVYPTIAVGDQAHIYAYNLGTEAVKISNLKAWSMKKAKIH